MGIALQVVIIVALAGLAVLGGIQGMGWLIAGIVFVWRPWICGCG